MWLSAADVKSKCFAETKQEPLSQENSRYRGFFASEGCLEDTRLELCSSLLFLLFLSTVVSKFDAKMGAKIS